jgi:polyhydroxybutyrate depolymerase
MSGTHTRTRLAGGQINRHRRRIVGVFAAVGVAASLAGVGLAPSAGAHPRSTAQPAVRTVVAKQALGLVKTNLPSPLAASSRVLTTTPSPPLGGKLETLKLPGGRKVYLHLPADAKTTQHRLLLVLHGWHQTGQIAEKDTGLDATGDRNGLIVAYGAGLDGSWNAGSCCGTALREGLNDIGYVVNAIQAIEANYPVVQNDVVVAGFSNGGMLAAEAACTRPDVIHAAASVEGTLLTTCPAGVRLLHIHGVKDQTVPLDGGWSSYTKSWFPSALTEKARLLHHSHYALYIWKGAHSWPTASTGLDANALILRMF